MTGTYSCPRAQRRAHPGASAYDWGFPVNTTDFDNDPSVSADGTRLYFGSVRPGGMGGYDIWQAPILPVVDLNLDGRVDFGDYARLVQSWAQNDSQADVAPPIGDGIVDLRDVAVIAEYWLTQMGLLAHWRLDETEGAIAYDSAGDLDGTLYGDPVWQPHGGATGGAIELDGDGDYVSTGFVRSPAQGPFSVFCWVRGETAGQVALSQVGGENWLFAMPGTGWIMTNLKDPDRAGRPLFGEAVITDGQWHRIGLTWDGENRTLYVDDQVVTADTQAGLEGETGGLYFGADANHTLGLFWSGRIDDVQIYDRAVRP